MLKRTGNAFLFSALIRMQHALQALKVTHTLRKSPLLQTAYSYLYLHCMPREAYFVNAGGHRLFLDLEDMGMSRALVLSGGVWERAETIVMERLVREGMTVVDIGANLGFYTLLAARLVGLCGKVFAFEPSPNNFAYLNRNVQANGYGNVVLIRKAVCDQSGTARFDVDARSSGTHRLSPPDASGSISVDTTSLDAYFDGREAPVDFIKMDVEGAEPRVLSGMRRVIGANPDLIVLAEFSPGAMRALGHSPARFLQDLRDCGFELYSVQQDGAMPKLVRIDKSFDVALSQSAPSLNLFCLRGKRVLSAEVG